MRWQPRSIRQLVLLGFLLVVAPLGIAVGLTVQLLDQQASANADLTQRTIALTRLTQQLQSDLLDLERRARQFVTLEDPELLRLVQTGLDGQQRSMAQLMALVEQPTARTALQLRQLLTQLQDPWQASDAEASARAASLQLFDPISQQLQLLKQHSRRQVDEAQARQLAEAAASSRWLLGVAAGLAGLTLAVALLFSYWISRPVQQVERVIRQLGSAQSEGEIRISGPSEIQLLGRQLSWLRDHLLELDAQKQQFLRHISHELKTPLASLREGADLLAEGVVGPQLTAGQSEIVSIIQQNSQELQRLIENLLDYNQLLRQEAISPQVCELAPLLREVCSSHQLALQRQRLRIDTRIAVAFWSLDPNKTRAALDNLVSNACNYAAPDSVIAISAELHKGALSIEVANHGHRISEDETERIFEPFFQGRASRQGAIKGSGIGLSVARECIQAQGGSLRLVASKEYDVCFRLTLPPMEAV